MAVTDDNAALEAQRRAEFERPASGRRGYRKTYRFEAVGRLKIEIVDSSIGDLNDAKETLLREPWNEPHPRSVTLRLVDEQTGEIVATGMYVGAGPQPDLLVVYADGRTERYVCIGTEVGYEAVKAG